MSSTNNKNLGRGLSAFLSVDVFEDHQQNIDKNHQQNQVVHIDLDLISENPYQPRQYFDEDALKNLADSIKSKGVIQPIIVMHKDGDKYQLIAGERRLRASKLANMRDIPAIIVDLNHKEQLEIAILENIQREDLNVVEEAESYKRLIDEFNYTHEELSEILGKSRSHISNILRLLNLNAHAKQLLIEKKISYGHARALLGSENPEEILNAISDQSLSVRNTEQLIKLRKHNINQHNNGKQLVKHSFYVDPEIKNIEHQLEEILNMQTIVKMHSDDSGIIQIHFNKLLELDNLIRKMQGLK